MDIDVQLGRTAVGDRNSINYQTQIDVKVLVVRYYIIASFSYIKHIIKNTYKYILI